MAKSSNHTYDVQKWVNLSTFGKILALGYNLALRTPGVGSMQRRGGTKFCGRLLWMAPKYNYKHNGPPLQLHVPVHGAMSGTLNYLDLIFN